MASTYLANVAIGSVLYTGYMMSKYQSIPDNKWIYYLAPVTLPSFLVYATDFSITPLWIGIPLGALASYAVLMGQFYFIFMGFV